MFQQCQELCFPHTSWLITRSQSSDLEIRQKVFCYWYTDLRNFAGDFPTKISCTIPDNHQVFKHAVIFSFMDTLSKSKKLLDLQENHFSLLHSAVITLQFQAHLKFLTPFVQRQGTSFQ